MQHHSSSVEVAGGWFSMGSVDGAENERPVHRVWVDAFAIGPTPVTNEQYDGFLEATGHAAPPVRFPDPQQPVVAVSWLDAVAYCDWLTGLTGHHHRLPTEAEREYAARGGVNGAHYPWGDDPRRGNREMDAPNRVAQHPPNAFGLYDLGENVHEWCSDWYAPDYYAVSPDRNPSGPATGSRRTSRGGSWRHQIKITRCAARSSIPPAMRYADYGFRVATTAG